MTDGSAAATLVRHERIAPPRVPGFRSGWIRPPRRARDRWPGDVTASVGDALDGFDVPAWINGDRAGHALLVRRLAFTQAAMISLGLSYLVMSIGR